MTLLIILFVAVLLLTSEGFQEVVGFLGSIILVGGMICVIFFPIYLVAILLLFLV